MHKLLILLALLTFSIHSFCQGSETVFLEELTWTEVRDLMANGTKTIIVPTAGTEQNGPHVVLGKHKYRINAASERIARELGNALVAPVMTYVPEGTIDPPEGHMRYPGTISIPPEVFRSVLEFTARSLKAHGFKDILFIGDSGPNQPEMKTVADKMNKEWNSERTRILYISEWFTNYDFRNWLKAEGYSQEVIGTHVGLYDTALLLAVAPQHVRTRVMAPGKGIDIDGVNGDPTAATVELGKIGFDMSFKAAMKQIKELMREK